MPTFAEPLGQVAAVIAAIAFMYFAGASIYWASGGKKGLSAHWGGVYTKLPAGLRVMDAVSAGMFVFGTYAVIGRAWSVDGMGSEQLLTFSAYGLAALMAVSGIMNLASSSYWERHLFGPLALLIGALCFVVSRTEWTGG